jgi:hypothetical protein
MTKQMQGTLIVSVLISLFVGMVIGAALGEDFPLVGTAGDEPQEQLNAPDDGITYYQVTIEDAGRWLSETYPALETDIRTAVEEVAAVNTNLTQPLDQAFDTDAEMHADAVLNWGQAALIGWDEEDVLGLDNAMQMELPKDRDVTMCVGVDDDPFPTTDISDNSGVYVYMVVPEADGKNIPRDWEETEEKSATDLFWVSLLCDPGDGELEDEPA